MSRMINRSTFEVNGAFDEYRIFGTIEVTIAGQTRRVPAVRRDYPNSPHLNGFTAYGITGRYRTGMVAWPGHIDARDDWQNDSVHFGFDSRSGKHRKATISFA